METISAYFVYIPGIIIFLVGSAQVRQWLFGRKNTVSALVKKCRRIVKKDQKDRDVFNYFEITAQSASGETVSAKSPTEYAENQEVQILRGKNAQNVIAEKTERIFHPLAVMTGGALLILLALAENRGNPKAAMVYLCTIMLGAGFALLFHFIDLKKRNLSPISAKIIDIYARQLSKETKIICGSRFSYYPVVEFLLDGKKNIRRLIVNSSRKDSFKQGASIMLYYDAQEKTVLEHKAEPAALIAGIALLAAGLLSAASLLSVLIFAQS